MGGGKTGVVEEGAIGDESSGGLICQYADDEYKLVTVKVE